MRSLIHSGALIHELSILKRRVANYNPVKTPDDCILRMYFTRSILTYFTDVSYSRNILTRYFTNSVCCGLYYCPVSCILLMTCECPIPVTYYTMYFTSSSTKLRKRFIRTYSTNLLEYSSILVTYSFLHIIPCIL